MIKKDVQQGRSHFDARSVLPVREHGKMARTPLVAFFIISLPFPSVDPGEVQTRDGNRKQLNGMEDRTAQRAL